MADVKDMAVVETSMANPKQAVNVLENIDKVSASNTPTQILQDNPALFKQQENNMFFDSEAWADYKTNMLRAYDSTRYPGFASIESTASNPVYNSIINRYGDAIAKRAQGIHATYARANNWLSRLSDAYNVHRYGLRAGAARKDLSNAIRDGDEAEISKAKMRYQSEQRKSYEEGVSYEEYGDTLMSLAASVARNPETLIVEGVGAALSPFTGGTSLLAANAINAGIVGFDTYRIEAGGALQELDEAHPEMSEEEKFKKAMPVGAINAAIEAGAFGLGGNLAGRTLKTVGKEAAIKSTIGAVRRKTGEEITRDAAKELIKVDFLKALQKPAAEENLRNTIKEVTNGVVWGAAGEGGQEVFQNSVTNAMLASVKNGTTLTDEILDDWADFVVNPFNEKHADKWETFINVAAASLVLGGGMQGGTVGLSRITDKKIPNTTHDGFGTIDDKMRGAYNNTLGLSQLFNWHKNADSKNAITTSNAVLEDQIKRGEVSGKLYTTAQQVEEMQQDPEIAAALEQMGIANSLSESADNGGVVEIDLLAYDKIVNESQNEVLFQKMRNYLSFSDTTMSINEFNQFINSKGKEAAALITDEIRSDQESAYNKLKAMALKAGRTAERAEGYAVLGHVLLNNLQAITKGEKNDILDRLSLTINNGTESITEKFGVKVKETEGEPAIQTQGLSRVNGSTLTSFDKQGNLKDDVWQQIRSLFPEEKLKQVYSISNGGSKTFEELLRSTVDKPQQVAQEYKQNAIDAVAKHYDITPEQLTNAIRLARGEAVSTSADEADVNVGAMVNNTFTENEDGKAPVYHMFVGSRKEETVNDMADSLGKRKELDEARAIEKEAIDKGQMPDYEAIWAKTGWYKEPDTSWSYEIDDSQIKIKDESIQNLTDDGGMIGGSKKTTKKHMKLQDLIEHEELFDLVPSLKNINVIFYSEPARTYKHGRYSRTDNAIYLNSAYFNEQVKYHRRDFADVMLNTLVHEIQHAIQWEMSMLNFTVFQGDKGIYNAVKTKTRKDKLRQLGAAMTDIYELNIQDNFLPAGTNTAQDYFAARSKMYAYAEKHPEAKKTIDKFVDLYAETKDYNIDAEGSHVAYLRRAFEVQARNAATRRMMTEAQRRQTSPSATYDIAGKVQVGTSRGKEDLEKNTRELRVVKFATTPIDVEAGRTTAQDGKYNIVLTPEANAVTFAHELFHVFSLEIQRVYNNGTITDFWKAQAEKMFKISGAKVEENKVLLTASQEEHLANMFTTFIMRGKIENYEVKGLLSKLVDLFNKTYRQLEGAGLTPVALDATALSFFNTVISSQDAIEEIQRNAGLLEIAQPEGVDRELYDYYVANLASSKIEASNDLRKKWYAIDMYKKSAEYTKKMQELKDEAKAVLLEEDRYKILAQASLYQGEEDKAQQTLMWAEKNMPEANYTLGDITDIIENTPSLEEASTKDAEEEMDKYLAKKFNITPQDIGFKEERNRAKVRALLAESVMQRGGTLADIDNEIKKAEAASDKLLAKTSVYQIMDLGKWKNREAAAVERYSWARQEDRKDLMSAERYNQAVLNLIMIKSNGFKAEYQKLSSLFDKLQTKQKKYKRKDEQGKEYGPAEHRYHAEDWELLRSISENFGNKIRDGRRSLKTVHEQIKDWIQTQVENRFTTVAGLEEFIPFVDKGFDGSIGAMKGKDFKKLWAVMHTIDSIAMREQQLYLDGQYEEMNQYIAETLEFRNKMSIKTDEDKNGWYQKYFGRYGTWTNPEPLLRAIFPERVFQKIFLPMINGALKSEAKGKQWIQKWNNAKAKINTSNEAFVMDDGSQITYGEETQKTMTYGDVANLLIAMGAEHSYENYKLKFGLSDEQATRIASQAIKRNAAYVDFMNTTWEVYGEATELLNNSFQERTNELFVRKEHRAFEIDGIKFEGGYVPEDKHYIALVRELGTWNQGMVNKVQNKNEKLITKLADGDILSIIDITETKLSQSAKWAFAAIPYNNVKKFIEQKAVRDAIGDRGFNFIKDWLQNWDTPHFDESGVWRPLTRVTTIAALGARASTALLQLSGLVQSFTALGPTYLARGMLQFVRENAFFHPFKGPAGKSLYMATRVEDPFAARFGAESQGRSFKEILDSYNAKSNLGKVGTALLSAYQTLAMCGIQIIDGWVATITWNGAYARALDKGMTEAEARMEADSIVRITQSDATQISRSSAMQEPWARSVTAFATWTMAMRSQVVALSSSKNYRKDMVIWIASYAVMSSFIEAFLKEMTEPADEGEEDKEMLERIMNSWYNKIVEAFGTQVMPFAGAGATAAKYVAASLVNTDDDKIFKVFAGGSVPALQYASRAAMTAAQSLAYMRSGEQEDLDKLLIQSAGLVSYELKKRVKQALED